MLLKVIDWLFTDVIIHRNIDILWYIAITINLILAIMLAIITGLKRFGCAVLVTGAIMSAIWETTLFLFGYRAYDNELARLVGPIPELIYHSFAEWPATMLIGLIAIYKLGIIDLEKFN